jgi:hypothetical protein
MPPGIVNIMTTSIAPCMSMLSSPYLASGKCRKTTMIAPTIGPSLVLMPPMTVASSDVISHPILKAPTGLIYPL